MCVFNKHCLCMCVFVNLNIICYSYLNHFNIDLVRLILQIKKTLYFTGSLGELISVWRNKRISINTIY